MRFRSLPVDCIRPIQISRSFTPPSIPLARFMSSANGAQNGSSKPQDNEPNYTHWTNTDLINRITNLEAQLRAQCSHHSATLAPQKPPPPPSTTRKPQKKPPKPINPSKYTTRPIALKFAYLGARYNGFEYHANNRTPLPTVEEELWKALRKTRLIFPRTREGRGEEEVCWDGCGYSKCGRTDRGVSAFGQVVGVEVRSSRPKEGEGGVEDGKGAELEREGVDSGEERGMSLSHESDSETQQPAWDPIKDELPYVQLLNRVLPPDIRMLAWCPNPPANFSARFNCKERRYRYFFTNPAYVPGPHASTTAGDAWLDIEAMQQAAKRLEGLHDFRNFCKVDPSKQITNFERRIFHASIQRLDSDIKPGAFLQQPPFASTQPLQMYFFEVHGSAFLWHQVRHLVAVLFLVGQGYESPDIVDKLLDVQNCPAKPVYEMADELPLVLWDCVFPDPEEHGAGDAHANRNGVSNGSGYKDALEWIYVGDNTSNEAEGKPRSVVEGMQDRKYGRLGIMEDLWSQWRRRKIDEVLAGSLMDVVARQGSRPTELVGSGNERPVEASARVFDGSGTPRNVGKYIPLMQRQRMEKPEVLNARYVVRKGLNGSHGGDATADPEE